MPIKLGVQDVKEIKQVAKLPDPIVTTTVAEDGNGFTVSLYFPLPEPNEVQVTERKKKDTEEISSVTSLIGLARDIPLTFEHEGKTVGLIDEQSNQIVLFVAKVGTKVGSEESANTAE